MFQLVSKSMENTVSRKNARKNGKDSGTDLEKACPLAQNN